MKAAISAASSIENTITLQSVSKKSLHRAGTTNEQCTKINKREIDTAKWCERHWLLKSAIFHQD